MSIILQTLLPGAFLDDPNAEFTFNSLTKSKANFDAIKTAFETVGNHRYFTVPISLEAGATEWAQVADAINAREGVPIPAGFKPLFRVVEPYSTLKTGTPSEPSYYNTYYYTVIQGTGFYGTGTPPTGFTQINVLSGQVVPLGEFITQAQDVVDLGEIGTTPIQTAVNASATEIVVTGFTIFQVLRSGVLDQYEFTNQDGSYGASWTLTAASDFNDVYGNTTVNKNVSLTAAFPSSGAADISITASNLFKTNRLTNNNAIITINDDATTYLESGSWARVYLSGTGTHTINYPITDGANTLSCVQGDLIYIEKLAADEWIVKKY